MRWPSAAVPLFKRTLTDVSARRRRFFTATPRIHDDAAKSALKEAGALSFSMDDPDIYGDVMFTRTVKWAISEGHLSPFTLMAPVITEESVREQLERNGWTDELDKDSDGSLDAIDDLATVVFTLKTAVEQGMMRILTFHNEVKKAQRAVETFEKVAELMGIEIVARAVSADSSKRARGRAKRMLKAKNPEAIQIVCNVNLFGEGVDTPALDGIVYFDSKSSVIAVVQSVGRALRRADDKEQAYILIPVYVPEGEDMQEAVKNSRFNKLVNISTAMGDLGINPEQIDTIASVPGKERAGGGKEFTWSISVPEGWDIEEFLKGIKSMMISGHWAPVSALSVALDMLDTHDLHGTWVQDNMKFIIDNGADEAALLDSIHRTLTEHGVAV